MKCDGWSQIKGRKWLYGLCFLLPLFLLISCASVDPRQVDVELKEQPPEVKTTSFTEALTQLGMMSEIYNTPELKIQSKDIADNTGTSMATGAEVPRDITEMLQSTLNSIGGKVMFIPYNPSFIQNQMITGYSQFDNKVIPDVVVTGGITEFDRGLETRGSNVDVSAEADFTGAPKWVPATTVGADYGAGEKFGLASITLDFNLIDFQTMTGVARMQTVNSIKVAKAVSEKEVGITLLGPTFGLKGSIKKVQGRHAAIRLLVQLSMIQIVGKYLMLPYWTLIQGAEPDQVVLDELKKSYYDMNEGERVVRLQELLFVQGYDVTITGELDQPTLAAIQQAYPAFDPAAGAIDKDTYIAVYTSVPMTDSALERRIALNKAYEEAAAPEQPVADAQAQPQQAPEAVAQQQPAAAEPQPEAQTAAEAPAAAPQGADAQASDGRYSGKTLGGRMLSDDEW